MTTLDYILGIKKKRDFKSTCTQINKKVSSIQELIEFISDDYHHPIPEYASWILVHLSKDNPNAIQPFYKILIELLFKNKNQSVRRNLINVIDQLELSDYKESDLIDLLISFIQDFENKVAVQVYSIQVLTKFVHRYPELKEEILEIVVLHSENKSPAFSASIRKFLRRTKNI